MAKMITRTISVHMYTTGRVDLASAKVTDIKEHFYPYKLNERQKRALAKEDGNPILQETTGDIRYAMSIDDFIQHAKPVNPNEEVE